MKVHSVKQGTDEWLDIRRPFYTASALGVWVMQEPATWKAVQIKARQDAIYNKVITDRLQLEPAKDSYKNDAMQRGNDLEEEARREYICFTGNDVEEVGFVEYDEHCFGCSPDGFIDDRKGMLEIKCPLFKTFDRIRQSADEYKKYQKSYLMQIHVQMAVAGAEYVDFFQYYPRLESLLVTVKRDETTELVLANLNALSKDTLELENELKEEMGL